MAAVIDIIAENIPDLEALNLNDNKLNMIDHMKVLSSKLPQLKIIYLANNRIVMLSSLDAFKNLPIVELFLDGNPCKKRFKDNSHYVSEVKRRFPKLMKLDGVELGPVIGFDVSEESKNLPSWKQLYFCNASGQDLIAKFIEQYFAIYDSDNRQQLLDAYHENAMLSITATNNQHYTQDERLFSYYKFGRNLMHPKGFEHRFASLKRGKLVVVALLNDLPPTKHDPQSFAVDLTFFTPQMIVLTITGIFKERNPDPKLEFIRTFQKTITIVPNNGGFCIRNELLHVNNSNPSQAKKAFKTVVVGNLNAHNNNVTLNPAASTSQQQQPTQQLDEASKFKMIEEMSRLSQMNLEWSKKCLEETNWDFTRAGFVFQELFKQNKIPQEAFAK
ncbi:hypothetical protein PVAND_006602 [Polypedilum vanderplanki]|uniref:Nuclear RNA export factor 1-like protein n=1 Tax=Polypedilum vanderplanki TaxID=319348 RepID=A0A9J6C469_POLVA|nr:hypothetical protein PVAND_006602 [Polypedilum vanderplanki]